VLPSATIGWIPTRQDERSGPREDSGLDPPYTWDGRTGCQGRTPYFFLRARPHQHPPIVRTMRSPWIPL
jgi:hypothetical protein